MATLVSGIIDQAFQLLGVTQPGETLSAAIQTNGFVTLNQLLSTLSADQPTAYKTLHQDVTLTAGTSTYTFGTSGTLVATSRPVRITGWQSKSGTFENGGRTVSFEALHEAAKNNTGKIATLAEMVAADSAYPAINIQVYPTPSTSPGTLRLDYWSPITAFAAVSDAVDLPDGYEALLVSSLAVKLAPTYERVGGMPQSLASRYQNDAAAVVNKNAAVLGLATTGSNG